MTTALLILHFCVTVALIGVVLIQRSEGGGLGVGSSQGMGAFMSGRGTANLLTRTTAVLAGLFMLLSLTLALLYRGGVSGVGHDILAQPQGAVSAPPQATVFLGLIALFVLDKIFSFEAVLPIMSARLSA